MAAPPNRTELVDDYPNPSTGVYKAGLGKFYDYVKGLLGLTGNAADARNALGVGSVLSFRNLLLNGSFSVNQRVYASATATTTANQYTLDCWRVVVSGQSVTFGAATPDRVVTAPAGGIEQVIEGMNMAGGVYTLSWEGTATATVNGTAITNGGQTTALTAGANATIRLSGGTVGRVQFELGTVATPFERRPVGLELSLCQRYCYTFVGVAGGSVWGWGICASGGTSVGSFLIFLPTNMRATPTINSVGAGTIQIFGAVTSAAGALTSITLAGNQLVFNSTSASANAAGAMVGYLIPAGMRMIVSADL